MRKHRAAGLVFCTAVVVSFGAGGAAENYGKGTAQAQAVPAEAQYCKPGDKFCRVPGSDGVVSPLDTHFGMDADTGEVVAYKGNVHPNEVYNNQITTEQVIYQPNNLTATPNGYVPSNAPQRATTPSQALSGRTSEVAYQQSSRPPKRQAAPAQAASARPRQVDVPDAGYEAAADIEADRVPWYKGGWWRNGSSESGSSETAAVAEDQKVPWYKGGWWRNKKDPEPEKEKSTSASSSKKSSGKQDQPRALSAADDMWGDEGEFNGYNSDGSFASQGGYGQDPDPFGAPQVAPTQQQMLPGGYVKPLDGGYVNDPYPLAGSPGPTSPYPPGYTYPGTDISYESMNTTTYTAQPIQTYQEPMAYAPPPPGMQTAAPMPPQSPSAQYAAEASPEFASAVEMVKNSRFAEAKSLLQNETAQNPSNAAAWRWLGDCQYNLLELPAAIESYQRAISLDPDDYYALRGQGFAYLHRGHELWRQMMGELRPNDESAKAQAAATFSQAHENYKRSLEVLAQCLQKAPNDSEAIYGEAMAAEGASRKLYSNAISYLKLGPENRQRAELFAENCIAVINKGVERAIDRASQNPGESGPRALLGGLYLRKAMLYNQLGKNDLALNELKNSYTAQKSILEIDKNNQTALKGVADCENYWRQWGGQGNL